MICKHFVDNIFKRAWTHFFHTKLIVSSVAMEQQQSSICESALLERYH